MYIPGVELIISYVAIFTNLLIENPIKESNLTYSTNYKIKMADLFYSNPNVSCSLKYNPLRLKNYIYDTDKPQYLKPMFKGTCKEIYALQEFIEQYDNRHISRCANDAKKLRQINQVFQSDLNSACQNVILRYLPDYYDSIFNKDLINLGRNLIKTFLGVKCLVLQYDFNNNCPNKCDEFIYAILQYVEPLMCQIKYKNLGASVMTIKCGLKGHKMLKKYIRYGNGALLEEYSASRYCRGILRNSNDQECVNFINFDSSKCENEKISDFIHLLQRKRVNKTSES